MYNGDVDIKMINYYLFNDNKFIYTEVGKSVICIYLNYRYEIHFRLNYN